MKLPLNSLKWFKTYFEKQWRARDWEITQSSLHPLTTVLKPERIPSQKGPATRDVRYTLQPILGQRLAPKIDGGSRLVGSEAKGRESGKGEWEWEMG